GEASTATGAAFRLRPGLVAEMLRFYDHIRRQTQSIDRFEELLMESLGADDDLDRGATRMPEQPRFLAGAFREYELRVRATGRVDEHLLREQLIGRPSSDPVRHVVVTVADWIADTDGLYVADFDVLARIPGLEALDVVATENVLGSGFHERLHSWRPGSEETRSWVARHQAEVGSHDTPVLATPEGTKVDEPWFVHRDREEELVAVARQLKADRRARDAAPLGRVAVVYKNPLPYLYLAAAGFGSAGIPFQTADTRPLAAEPSAAALALLLAPPAAKLSRRRRIGR